METETARELLYFITTVAAAVWLAGLRFVLATFRRATPEPGTADEPGGPAATPRRLLTGRIDVEGEPEGLAAKAAAVLAKDGLGLGLPVKILERSCDRVVFEGAEQAMGGENSAYAGPGPTVHQGQLRFTSISPGRTGVDYAVALASGAGLRIFATVFLVLGLVAILAGFWLIYSCVAPHPLMGVRGQSFQMIQVVHFLWPPFLLAGLQRARYRTVRGRIETLVHNLPYYPA